MISDNMFWLGNGQDRNASPSARGGAFENTASSGRVLIVEDELFVAWHLETLVREMQLDVVGLVPDGEGAVEQACDAAPDLILMDINLSGQIDGVEAARRILARGRIPIIFITAYTDADTLARVQRAAPGVQVLAKPVSADRLRLAVDGALSAPQA